jgi:hypothetical protein
MVEKPDRQHEGIGDESRPAREPEANLRRSARSNWLARIFHSGLGSWRTCFLLVSAAAILHVSVLVTVLLLFGYSGFESLDRWLAKRAKDKVIDEELFGWKTDADDPEYENQGDLNRIRLTGQNQIIVARIADLLRRIP